MMSKKSKLIDYEKFVIMNNELGEGASDIDTVMAILRAFYSKDKRPWNICIKEFDDLQKIEVHFDVKLDLDFENKPAEYYITASIYEKQLNLLELHNHLSGKKESNISIQLAKQVRLQYLQSVDYFKKKIRMDL